MGKLRFASTIWYCSIPLVLVAVVSLANSQVMPSKAEEHYLPNASVVNTTQFLTNTSALRTNDCYPGAGWKHASGPTRSDVAIQTQQALQEIGIQALVEAHSYGEVDGCGTFEPSSIDFVITVQGIAQISAADQQRLADIVQPTLAKFAKPNLGNVKIIFPQGNTITRSNMAVVSQLATSTASANWQQVATMASPQGRYTHGFAYDSHRSVAVLFGGDSTGFARLNDTWEFDGTNWHQVSPTQSPPGRVNVDQTLTFDSNRNKIVLFGGLGVTGYLSDTWEYDGTTWLQISTSLTPQKRDSHAMAFDSHRGVTVLFGGYSSLGSPLNDTWEYNGTWQQVSTPQTPSVRYHHAMAFDTRRNVMVMFGGLDSSNSILGDTWEYDGTTWHSITPAQSPPPRNNHSMAFESARGVIVLFGGLNNAGPLNDTWEYDGTTWRQVTTPQSPSPRTEMSLAYDSQRGKTVFFGGGYWSGGALTVFTQTWEYTATITPPPPSVFNKRVYVIVYDPVLSNTQHLSTYLHWNDYATLNQGAVDFFRQTSHNGVNYTIVYTTVVTAGWPELVDGFRYSESEYLAVINGQSTPHSPDGVNYNKIVNSPQFDVCGKLNRGEIDEVWIHNGPYFGFYESTLVGPGAYWYNSPPVPSPYSCNKLLPIMGPSPERGLAEMIEDFGHRTESTMREVYGSWQQNRTAHSWERFALVKALSPNYSYSGCGNVHYPPNGTSDYDYGNPATVLSNCEDFFNYPNLSDPLTVAQPVTCSAWSCSHLGYFSYWFYHLPSNSGCGPDQVSSNWWYYFVDPALALTPSTPCYQNHVFLPVIMR